MTEPQLRMTIFILAGVVCVLMVIGGFISMMLGDYQSAGVALIVLFAAVFLMFGVGR